MTKAYSPIRRLCAVKISLEETPIEVWWQALVENDKVVELGGGALLA